MIRFFILGWLFAAVIVASWLGLIGPAPAPTHDDEGDQLISESISELLGQVEARGSTSSGIDRFGPPDSRTCPSLILDGPLFASNDAELGADGRLVMATRIEPLSVLSCITDPAGSSCPAAEMEIAVGGHTDDVATGRSGGNQQLSFDRAQAVADWMMENGFTIRSVSGFGASRPAPAPYPDDRSAAEAAGDNRRVSIHPWCPRR